MPADYYNILGIESTANLIQIKKAYRLLALKYHPDVCKLSNASEIFIKVQEAYEILSDENKRNIYDRLREPHNHTVSSNSSTTEDRIKYRQWASEANQNAKNMANTSFSTFKSNVIDNLTNAIGASIDFLGIILAVVFAFAPFIGMYTSYNSIKNWDIDRDGNAITGFVICSLLSLFFTIQLFFRLKEELFDKRNDNSN